MNNECDVLYICGTLEYGSSVSGNYILYKSLKKVKGMTLKVLPIYDWISDKEEPEYFLPHIQNYKSLSIRELIEKLPNHKVLFISGNDFSNVAIHAICTHFGSKLVTITMSHWIFGNTSHYPELENDFDGPAVRERLALFESIDSYILTGSTNSYLILKQSLFKNIKSYVIPFPFDEVDTYNGLVEKNEKSILWGTQQPLNPRKGKDYFEKVLEKLYDICENPNEILIKQIGPKVQLKTKFNVEQLGEIPNRVELSKIYKSSKVFALTTLADAGPMMALECIKNETPLISFATNISTDLVDAGKNGYIAESIDEYANYLYDVIYNNKFHIDSEHVKNFNSEKSVDESYQLFFDKILEK
jgi:glycosyltransferase involved in cell wall biosynthesis